MFDLNYPVRIIVCVILLISFGIFVLPSTVTAQNKEVVAESGDGIYRLLVRNGLSAAEFFAPFVELNKDKLGKENTLIAGRKYLLPAGADAPDSKTEAEAPTPIPKNSVLRFDIFGKKYAEVEIKSNELKGAIYYLVSGHGGPDPGAIGKYEGYPICEDEYAYDVTLRMARSLIEKGATVYMIIIDKNDGIRDEKFLKVDNDEVCYPDLEIPLNQIKRLRQRTDAVNKLYKQNPRAFQRMIVVHIDSRSKRENIDVFFYHDEGSKTGKKVATILQKTFHEKYNEHQPGRGYNGTVTSRNLYVIKNSFPPAVFIELGNVNHQRDIQRIIIPDNRQALANWLTMGLVKDFQTNK